MGQQQNDKIGLLQKIFDNTNRWLHFAEAKNASLSAFNVALIAVVSNTDLLINHHYLTYFMIIFLTISTVFAILSFKPINTPLEKTLFANLTENLLHFGYISSLEPEQYLLKLYATYWNETNKRIDELPQIEIDYCREIVENAKITMRKQTYFKFSLYTIISMFIIIGILCFAWSLALLFYY